MKLKNLKKALEKNGATPYQGDEINELMIGWKLNGYMVTAYPRSEDKTEVSMVNVRHEKDNHDIMTDYHAGILTESIKAVLHYAGVKV